MLFMPWICGEVKVDINRFYYQDKISMFAKYVNMNNMSEYNGFKSLPVCPKISNFALISNLYSNMNYIQQNYFFLQYFLQVKENLSFTITIMNLMTKFY